MGRETETADLLALLHQGDAVVRAAIEGLPGVGKTEVAIQVAHRAVREGLFPGGVFWFDAERSDLTVGWDAVGEALGIPGAPGAERAAATLSRVRTRQDRVLIVLDNVTTWSREGSPAPLPEGDHVRLLVTTRQGQLGGTRFRHHHRLRFLPADASRRLLEDIAGRLVPDAIPLIEHLEGHALAVELAGAFLQVYPEVTARAYLGELLGGANPSQPVADRTRYEATVEQALRSLWVRLDDATRQAWRRAACFAPQPVSVPLAEACGLGREERRWLRELHLVDDEGEGRIRMHRLVRGFGLVQCDGAAQRAFVEGCLTVWAGETDPATGYKVLARDGVHLIALVDGGPGWSEATAEEQSELLARVGTSHITAGFYGTARILLEKALENDLRNFDEYHSRVAASRSNLAAVRQALGDFEGARSLLEKALEGALCNLGEEHPDVATCRSNLAGVLRDIGDLTGARSQAEKALESGLCSLGEEHPSVATRRSNLALVLIDLGDLAGARALLEKALESDRRYLGEYHPFVTTRRNNLAMALKDLGDLAGARSLLESAIESDLRNLGEDHPNVATSRSNLAAVRQALGDLEGARSLLEKALEGALCNLGEEHPDLATCRLNLAGVLRDIGDLTGARSQAEKALRSALHNFGEDHPRVATFRSNLALVLFDLGDLAGARLLLKKALRSALHNLGDDHPAVAVYGMNLAATLHGMGKHKEARRQAQEALRVARLQPEGSQIRTGVERISRGIIGERGKH